MKDPQSNGQLYNTGGLAPKYSPPTAASSGGRTSVYGAGMLATGPTTGGMGASDSVLERGLKGAWSRNELRVLFQPIVKTIDSTLSGVEALLRWDHPQYGEISPVRFIRIAEQSGSIVQIGEWVLNAVCAQLAKWARAGYIVRASVNVSPYQLLEPGFEVMLQRAIEAHGISPSKLEVELTESIHHDSQVAPDLSILSKVRELGCPLALDDFGTQANFINRLRVLEVDKVKFDRGFLSLVGSEPLSNAQRASKGYRLLQGLVAMIHNLDWSVVMEGVETDEQLALAREVTCDEIQGYYFGKPVPPQILEMTWLQAAPMARLQPRTTAPLKPSDIEDN